MDAGHEAVLAARAALGEPEWTAGLMSCGAGTICPARIQLIDIAEALRQELQRALRIAHRGSA